MSQPVPTVPENSQAGTPRPRSIARPAVSNDYPVFRARAPWWGGDLQTVRNRLVRSLTGIPEWVAARLLLPLADGSGDRLAAGLSEPEPPTQRPLAVLIHGLTGCETSTYMFAAANALQAAGYPVLRLNLRGAGPSRASCAGQYHAGRSEDLRDAIAALPPAVTENGVVAIGFSLGGNVLLKLLGEMGVASPIMAGISVSAPIDLATCTRVMMRPRNAAYHAWLLNRMKHDGTAPGAVLSGAERAAITGARSIYAFDDAFVASRHGFAGADDYYAQSSAQRYLADVRVPTLLIHARNDPWIPHDMYEMGVWQGNQWVQTIMADGGGHLGFHCSSGPMPWHLRCALRFLDDVLS